MKTKSTRGSKPRAKKPKPNLHGPNSPTPKKKMGDDHQELDADKYVVTKTTEMSRETG